MATDGPLLNDFSQESLVERQSQNYQAAMNGQFLNENLNEVFSINEPSQEMIHSEGDFPTSSQETAFSLNDFDFLQGVEARPSPLSGGSGTDYHFSNGTPALSQETAFSFNDFNPSEGIETSPNILSASPQTSFAFPDCIPLSSQESSSSSLTPAAISPSTPTTAPNSPNHSPDRQPCRRCPLTFKRAGDLKRHEKVHAGQRDFPCRQPACSRKGGKGFYRKDKMKAHEKQVHGMHL